MPAAIARVNVFNLFKSLRVKHLQGFFFIGSDKQAFTIPIKRNTVG